MELISIGSIFCLPGNLEQAIFAVPMGTWIMKKTDLIGIGSRGHLIVRYVEESVELVWK